MSVPQWSVDGYRAVVGFADSMPKPLHWLFETGTDAGIVALLGSLMWHAWQVRRAEPRRLARALLVPVGVVFAYGVSEIAKLIVTEERPCRAVVVLAGCPAPGDWSFPSNHSTIAAAATTGLVLAAATALIRYAAVVIALLVCFSRVVVGAHYPHDVLAGMLLGTLGAAAAVLLLTPLTTRLLERARPRPATPPPPPRADPRVAPHSETPLEDQPTRRIPAAGTARGSGPAPAETPTVRLPARPPMPNQREDQRQGMNRRSSSPPAGQSPVRPRQAPLPPGHQRPVRPGLPPQRRHPRP